MADSAMDKTEPATTKRRRDEREKGHIPQSPDITAAVTMVVTFGALKALGSSMMDSLGTGMRAMLNVLPADVSSYGALKSHVSGMFSIATAVALPIMLIGLFTGVAVTLFQTRLSVTSAQLKPDFGRLSPLQGIKRMFSLRSLEELGKSILKIVLVGVIVYTQVQPEMHTILLLYNSSLATSFAWIAGVLVNVGLKVSIVMLVLGVGDYFFQVFQYEKDIRMTKQEIKDEFKQTEGNPEIKGKIRSLQRQYSRARMMQSVPKADVVLRNPTHYAVALQYVHGKQKAPVCLAKGQNAVALRIVEIAEENHVHIIENPPLTRALYKAVRVGDQIPPDFYKAVAEVLAYIYRLRRAGR